MTKRIPFFLVWREGGGQPTVRHPTVEVAQGEAGRLARSFPGERFFVMAPVESVVRVDVERTAYDLDGIVTDDQVPF